MCICFFVQKKPRKVGRKGKSKINVMDYHKRVGEMRKEIKRRIRFL